MDIGPDGALVYRARLKLSFKYETAGLGSAADEALADTGVGAVAGRARGRCRPLHRVDERRRPDRLAGRRGQGRGLAGVPRAVVGAGRGPGARPRRRAGHHRRQPRLVLRLGGDHHGHPPAGQLRRQGRVPRQLEDAAPPARAGHDPRRPAVGPPGDERAADRGGRPVPVRPVRHLPRGHPLPRRRAGARAHRRRPHRGGQRRADHPDRHLRHGGDPAARHAGSPDPSGAPSCASAARSIPAATAAVAAPGAGSSPTTSWPPSSSCPASSAAPAETDRRTVPPRPSALAQPFWSGKRTPGVHDRDQNRRWRPGRPCAEAAARAGPSRPRPATLRPARWPARRWRRGGRTSRGRRRPEGWTPSTGTAWGRACGTAGR